MSQKPVLMQRFGISDTQAEAILELKPASPGQAGRGQDPRRAGMSWRMSAIGCRRCWRPSAKLNTLIKKEIQADAQTYGDDRRSPLTERAEAKAMSEHDFVPSGAGDHRAVGNGLGAQRQRATTSIRPAELRLRPATASPGAARGKESVNSSRWCSVSTPPGAKLCARSDDRLWQVAGEPLTAPTLPPGATIEQALMAADDQSC